VTPEPQNTPSIVSQDKQPVQQPKWDRRNYEKVNRGDPICMVQEERSPALRRDYLSFKGTPRPEEVQEDPPERIEKLEHPAFIARFGRSDQTDGISGRDRYTLPFLHVKIGDLSNEDAREVSINQDSYIKSVNALLRTHSVIGQILSARSGTFSANLVLDCITRMVQASGRYVALNHAIAAVLIYDREGSVREMQEEVRDDRMGREEDETRDIIHLRKVCSRWSSTKLSGSWRLHW
jgi:hypothetical protein